MVIPPNYHPFLDGIFHDIDQPFRGTPIYGNPPYGLTMLYGITMVFGKSYRILKRSYCTICLAIFAGDIPLGFL